MAEPESRERECCRCDCVQMRRVNGHGSCVWHVNRKEIMICGQRPAGVVCAQVHKNNQQTTGRALGKGSGSLPQSSTLVTSCTMSQLDNDGELSRLSQSLNWGLVNLARIDHPQNRK
jgi:hypothetical protein